MKSPIPWMGSKRRLADLILPKFPEHLCYVEPFAGSAALLFAREDPAKFEVLNDIDGELVNFFRVAKHHLLEFCNQFRFSVCSRQMFEWLDDTPPETLTDIQRAARFYYLHKLCFGAKSTGRTFGTATLSKPKLNLVGLEQEMSEVHARLARVTIEHLDWRACIERYDRPHTLFFLDPPYWQTAGYGGPFGMDDYRELAERMRGMQGKAIMTVNDHRDLRPIFRGFRRQVAVLKYTVGGNKQAKTAREGIYFSW